ncbi:MAG: hypothetical protein J0H40_17265 [Rhizobiales bacterium]|nr:hypothetical protein [Hyphomicrobiales bacterium]
MHSVKQLKSDFDSYLRGEGPSVVELAPAPLLDEWNVVISDYCGDYQLYLSGEVSGHPSIDNGHCSTSAVVWLDPKERWARTTSRVYQLGKRAETAE